MNLQTTYRVRVSRLLAPAVLVTAAAWVVLSAPGQEVDKRVLEAQAKRATVIAKVQPAVVAIFAPGGRGGGSGVLISKDGYALTNFHVVAGMMQQAAPTMQCGLPDGGYYDAVVVGVDKVGDVSLIKMLPKQKGKDFPFVPLGDSDKVKEGDWSLAMGNPFLLATDFKPTVTFGLISGVHRYQYPEGTLLEYTDCIQIDTSINPGNSGGPLFNMDGELIGINGRGSFDKRFRINSGVGYAISINQIKNFMGHLRAGLDADHATLGADVRSEKEEGDLGKILVSNVLEENSDVGRRGLRPDDQLWKFGFDSRVLTSTNHYKNVLGIYPKHWRVPLVYRRDNKDAEILVRLMGVQRQDVQPRPRPGPRPPAPAGPPSPAAKLYKAKKGFANYYFNELERDRLLAAFQKHGDFSGLNGDWTITAAARRKDSSDATKIVISEIKVKQGEEGKKERQEQLTAVKMDMGNNDYLVVPLKTGQEPADIKEPTDSGGMLLGLYLYHRLLTQGAKGFEKCEHGGYEPFYQFPTDGKEPGSLRDLRVDAEVLLTEHASYSCKFYFSRKDQSLLGFEARMKEDEDPCEVCFSDYKDVGGRKLPGTMVVRNGNDVFATFHIKQYNLAAK
jgi:S1-C subfamily serine protease